MKKRIITGICMGVIMLPILYLGGWYMIALTAVLSYIASLELIRMHSQKRGLSKKYEYILPIFSSMFVLLGGFMIYFPNEVNHGDILFTLLSVFIFMMIFSLGNKELKTTDILIFIGFLIYGGVLLFVATRSRYIETLYEKEISYLGLILMGYLFIATSFTDIGAYNVGIFFGKKKLCPTISPKKTVEGSIGGSLCGTIFGTAFLGSMEYVMDFRLFQIQSFVLEIVAIFFMTLLLTVVAQVGDLVASKLKREYEIKDYGFIFPGHGGVMDRFDSLIMTGSVFYLLLSMLGVIL